MDPGARQNAFKQMNGNPKIILSKLDSGARQNALKTKEWEPKNHSIQNVFWRSPKYFKNKGMGAQKTFSPNWILALAKLL